VKHKVSFIWLFLALFMMPVFFSGEGIAEEKKVYTLPESIEEAIANNWVLKAKKEKIDQARYVKKKAGSEFLPKLSTSYGYTRLSEVRRSSAALLPVVTGAGIPTGNFAYYPSYDMNTQDNFQWKFTATQPLFTGFALVSSFQLAKLGIDQSEMELELEKLDLALKVKNAYFGILKAEKALAVVRMAVESLEAHVKVARSFYNVGMIPINDLLKAEVELGNEQYDLVRAQNADRLSRSVFNIILSKPVNAPVDVKDVLGYKSREGVFEDYLETAFENRPEMKVLEINILQTDQNIRLAQSGFYPEIGLEFDYIKAGDHPDVSGSPFHDSSSWQAMAVASWNFWEWGKTHYSVQEKQAFKRELIQTKMGLQDSIRLELKEAMLALDEARKNIPTTKKAVEQAEENLRVSEERYKAQVTTSTEVLDAQTLLTQARTNYYNAIYNEKLARAKLLRALGAY
jgi:outer membrane protein